MNVIMPTAMITMHQDPNLAASSAKTSRRGTRLLMALLEDPSPPSDADSDSTPVSTTNRAINVQQDLIETNCQAILSVALNDLDEKNATSFQYDCSPSMLEVGTGRCFCHVASWCCALSPPPQNYHRMSHPYNSFVSHLKKTHSLNGTTMPRPFEKCIFCTPPFCEMIKQYWTDFFQKWGYQEPQKRDIANLMQVILKTKSP
jgi:hypothetical protein